MTRFLALITAVLLPAASAAESWLCIPDSSTGFDYNTGTKQWERVNFTSPEKFIVRRSKSERYTWEVVESGDAFATYYCKDDFDQFGFLRCSTLAEFVFSKVSLKFVIYATYGFFSEGVSTPKGKKPDSVYVEIGKCTEI